MNNNNKPDEHTAEPFLDHRRNDKGPDPDKLKPGCGVFVKWSNGKTYRGIVRKKLRENYSIEINDDQWHYSSNLTSVPTYALSPDNYPNAVMDTVRKLSHSGQRVSEYYAKKTIQ